MSNRTILAKPNLVDRRLATFVSQALPSGLSDQQIKKLLANAGALHHGLRLLLNADVAAIDGEMFAHVVAGRPAKIQNRHSFSRETLKTLGQRGYMITTIPAGLNMSNTLSPDLKGRERPYILGTEELGRFKETIEEVPTLFGVQVAWNPECPSEESSKWGYVAREEWFKRVNETLPLDCEAREPSLEEAGWLLRSYFAEHAKLPWEGNRNLWCLNRAGPTNSRLVMFQPYQQDFAVSFRTYTAYHGDIVTLAIVVPKRPSLASLKA